MLRAGAAVRDITPGLGGDFFGYVRPDLRARGVALRLHARALVLDDGQRRIGMLTLDLGAPLVTAEILERLGDLGYDAGNLLVAATHTHAGPNTPGAWVALRAAEALRAADAALRPARAAWSSAQIPDANHNRSLEAHLANHGLDLYPGTGAPSLDPHGADHPRDLTLRLLRVDEADGAPLAAWAHFSVHPTTFGPANTYLSADFPAAALHHFRAGFPTPPVAMLANGTEGDLVPRYDECNQHACADRMGLRVADAMRRAWAGAEPVDALPVDGAVRRIVYAGQEVEPGKRVARRAWFGLPFIGGAANGPHFLYGYVEGRRRPRALAGRVQGRKLLAMPAPWPPAADVTVVRIGDRLLLGVPGEPSVEAGPRVRAPPRPAAGEPITDALVVGLAQAYRGYFTTPEEYDQQHYEGGHTVFGRHTSLLVQRTHAELAAALTDDRRDLATRPADAAAPVPDPASALAAVPAPVGTAPARARLLTQPPETVARYETVTWSWRAAPGGRDRPLDAPYLVLEQELAPGSQTWRPCDDDLGTGFVWEQRGDRVTARYEVSGDLPTGTYRFVVGAAAVAVATRRFTVAACAALRVLGAVAGDDGRVVLRAQNPPPDPLRALRARERSPAGGTARLLVDDREHEAKWDDAAGGWVAEITPLPDAVTVSDGGLVDGAGNRSGAAVTVRVGTLRELQWPPPSGPAGGRCPAPFGLGTAGRPAPWKPAW